MRNLLYVYVYYIPIPVFSNILLLLKRRKELSAEYMYPSHCAIAQMEELEEFMSVNKFKGNGHKWLTEGLFLEGSNSDEHALYTLQPWDKTKGGKHFPSIHKLFVEEEDVSEWMFANKYFDGYQHWLFLKSRPFFKEYYEKMRDELEMKLQYKAVKRMLDQVEAGEASQATLAYLANKGYIDKAAVGKPKRKKPEDKARLYSIKSDLERIKR